MVGPTIKTKAINTSAIAVLTLLKTKIPLLSPLYTLTEIIDVAIRIIIICNSNPSAIPVNSATAEDTTEVPKPKPVADVAITPSKNSKSMIRPGHRSVFDFKTGSHAALKRRVGIFFM